MVRKQVVVCFMLLGKFQSQYGHSYYTHVMNEDNNHTFDDEMIPGAGTRQMKQHLTRWKRYFTVFFKILYDP